MNLIFTRNMNGEPEMTPAAKKASEQYTEDQWGVAADAYKRADGFVESGDKDGLIQAIQYETNEVAKQAMNEVFQNFDAASDEYNSI
jgi:hypothetical protein